MIVSLPLRWYLLVEIESVMCGIDGLDVRESSSLGWAVLRGGFLFGENVEVCITLGRCLCPVHWVGIFD